MLTFKLAFFRMRFSFMSKFLVPREISLLAKATFVRSWLVIVIDSFSKHVLWQIWIILLDLFFRFRLLLLFFLHFFFFFVLILNNLFSPSPRLSRLLAEWFECCPLWMSLLVFVALALLDELYATHPAAMVESVREFLVAGQMVLRRKRASTRLAFKGLWLMRPHVLCQTS